MADPYIKSFDTLDGPAAHSYAVVPDDNNDLATTAKAIYVGVAGDITLELAGDVVGTGILLKAVPVGLYKLRVRRIHATGTTATNIIALY